MKLVDCCLGLSSFGVCTCPLYAWSVFLSTDIHSTATLWKQRSQVAVISSPLRVILAGGSFQKGKNIVGGFVFVVF